MKATFFETQSFTRSLPEYLNDDEYQGLQEMLLKNPMSGDVIQGTGGFRKIRWQDRRRGKGKRGGLRVIYYWIGQDEQIWMFAIYDKDEISDLSPDEKKILKNAIETELKYRKARNLRG
jgi:mRNA-degrading endonuclease RelE of RelBE toxin-antitoxin system